MPGFRPARTLPQAVCSTFLPFRRNGVGAAERPPHHAKALQKSIRHKKGTAMPQQIILNTPLWVWALLAFLIYRGILASVDREVPLKRLLIIPAVMLALSVQGIVSTFGITPATALTWLPFIAIGAVLAWALFRRDSVEPRPARNAVFQRGSWTPLVLMMGIFLTKYAVGVTLAMQPNHAHELLFAAGVCALYGLFNGVFIGQVLRVFSIYRHA
jgi:putative Mn2+ efflux pump MntP